MSGEANDLTIDLQGALDPDHFGDVGVPAGAELLTFTNAVECDGDVEPARRALVDAIGDDAAQQAAAIVAVFNGLVRVADGTGIQLDAGVFTASVDEREQLGINRFAGAANSTDIDPLDVTPTAVSDLFG